jgi:type IV pilus assembly protein PilW
VAPAGSQTVNEWKDPTGEWASNLLDDAHIKRIKAIRLAVVGRSPQLEKEDVYTCPSDLELWSGGPKMTVSGDECKYRYKIFETIVPMKNVIWSQL